jgi:hypothetical protein
MFVRVHAERLVVDDLVQSAERLVVDAHPAFFFDHFAFVGERVLVDAERRHPVGLQPEDHRQILGRDGFPEHRFIVGRVGVALPAD